MQNRTHTHFTLATSFQGIMCEKVHLQELTLARFASRSSCRLTSLGLRLASCHFVHGDGACSPPSPSSPSCSRATSGSWSGCTGRFDNTGRQSRRQAPIKAKFEKVFKKLSTVTSSSSSSDSITWISGSSCFKLARDPFQGELV